MTTATSVRLIPVSTATRAVITLIAMLISLVAVLGIGAALPSLRAHVGLLLPLVAGGMLYGTYQVIYRRQLRQQRRRSLACSACGYQTDSPAGDPST
jgi:zinc transporter ZupT